MRTFHLLLGASLLVLALNGCDDFDHSVRAPASLPAQESALQFTVEDVFYLKPPVDRVIVVGTINEGAVRVGDKLTVHTSTGLVEVTVENIDSIKQGELTEASKGQQVGIRVAGISKDQTAKGDRVTAFDGK